MKPNPALILGVQPTSRGFGFVLFEGPFKAHDWGTVSAKGDKNPVLIAKLAMILDRHQPTEVLIEAEQGGVNSSERITRFNRELAALAAAREIAVHFYPFREVQACFRGVGADTRQEIAAAVARSVEALSGHLPKPRQPWESDHRRMSVYCAAALVLTHYQRSAWGFLEDLKRPHNPEAD